MPITNGVFRVAGYVTKKGVGRTSYFRKNGSGTIARYPLVNAARPERMVVFGKTAARSTRTGVQPRMYRNISRPSYNRLKTLTGTRTMRGR